VTRDALFIVLMHIGVIDLTSAHKLHPNNFTERSDCSIVQLVEWLVRWIQRETSRERKKDRYSQR
jgi:hypothetical protein